ncbi:hypothetical protein ACMFMG_007545 [Clarireedia jacksonii]
MCPSNCYNASCVGGSERLSSSRKDKTLTEILDRLKSVENKLDRLSSRPQPSGSTLLQQSPSGQPSFSASGENDYRSPFPSLHGPRPPSPPNNLPKINEYRHSTATHKILYWPAIQEILLQADPTIADDLRDFEKEGSSFIVRMQNGQPGLSLHEGLSKKAFVGMQSQATRVAGGTRITFPALTREVMNRLASAYFDTFNFLYPFLDRQSFFSDNLNKVYTEGFDGDVDSVLALLVFALGELALESSHGAPIATHNGRPSGVRGGEPGRPPGISLYNEARKKIGFVMTGCDIENVQIFSLAALYNQCCSRHVVNIESPISLMLRLMIKQDFWRLTVSASSACLVLITWGLHLELDLPLSTLNTLEDRVGVPTFNTPFCAADHRANQHSHWELHYASELALRRICSNIHHSISILANSTSGTPTGSADDFGIPRTDYFRQLGSQLVQWRRLLPRDLQWSEDEPTSFPSPTVPTTSFSTTASIPPVASSPTMSSHPLPPSQSQAVLDPSLNSPTLSVKSHLPLFTSDLDSEPALYPYVYDIQVALLRTRYYYAKYMAYRPFVYKALHFPEQMTQEDAESVAECLRSCLLWPLLLSPPSRRKRLIPYLFCWSQNFLGILLILHLTKHNVMLKDIVENLCGERYQRDVDQTIQLMLDWISDLKEARDPMAEWCWKVLRGIYWWDHETRQE